MRRSVVAATLVASCAVGAAVGAGLHTRWDPFPGPAGTAVVTAPASTTPRSGPSSPGPTPSRTPSPPPSPPPSRTPTPSPGPTTPSGTAPAFTRQALLQPSEFLARGWAVARQVDSYDGLPSTAITPCATIAADDVVAGYAATYASDRTTAVEAVGRYPSTADAERGFTSLRTAVAGCVDASSAVDRVRITDTHRSTPAGISELRWWNTRPLDDDPDRGVIGIVRVDDRIALVSLSSAVHDPADTTEITSLLTQAGLRLV